MNYIKFKYRYNILIKFMGEWAIYKRGFSTLREAEKALRYEQKRTSYPLKIQRDEL